MNRAQGRKILHVLAIAIALNLGGLVGCLIILAIQEYQDDWRVWLIAVTALILAYGILKAIDRLLEISE